MLRERPRVTRRHFFHAETTSNPSCLRSAAGAVVAGCRSDQLKDPRAASRLRLPKNVRVLLDTAGRAALWWSARWRAWCVGLAQPTLKTTALSTSAPFLPRLKPTPRLLDLRAGLLERIQPPRAEESPASVALHRERFPASRFFRGEASRVQTRDLWTPAARCQRLDSN